MSLNHDCLFCKIIDKKIPAQIVHEDDLACAFADVNPQAPHHYLIVPKTHIADIQSISKDQTSTIGHLFLVAQKIAAEKGLSSSGYRLVINNGADAGQTVHHVHLHILSGRRFLWPPG